MAKWSCRNLVFFIVLVCLMLAVGVSAKTGAIDSQFQVIHGEKKAYLNTVSKLYRVLLDQGLLDSSEMGRNHTEEMALLGTLSDTMNYKCPPRENRIIRSHFIKKLDKNGNFEMYVAVNSLYKGDEYFYLEGIMSESDLKTRVVYRRDINEIEYNRVLSKQKVAKSFPKSTSINNGSKCIEELIKQSEDTHCAQKTNGVCGRGQVTMDSWLNSTIAFQRSLASNVAINFSQWIGSHNSFNNKADGYGSADFLIAKLLRYISRGKWDFVWAQQYFSLTDQLNMGVRYLMLDPVYFWGAMRLCHCGGVTVPWIDSALAYIRKTLHIKLEVDSGNLGCLPSDRLFSAAVQEIRDWLDMPGHKSELVMIMLNDVKYDFDWGHKTLIWNPLKTIFGDLLFTQSEMKQHFPSPGSWPTPNQLLSLGKQVIVLGTSRIVNDSVFLDVSIPPWDKDSMKYFTPYPKCGGYGPGQWYTMGGESQVVGQIYNGPAEEGLIVTENFPYVMQCPVSISKLDLVSPALLNASIWSWLDGYSIANLTNEQCAVMRAGLKGRWTTASCNSTLCYHACRSSSNSFQVALSDSPKQFNVINCPVGFDFTLPINGYQNWQLYSAMMKLNSSSNSAYCTWLNTDQVITAFGGTPMIL